MVRLEVIKAELLENRLEFTIEESNVHSLKPGQRMLVDSDELAFIYILESEDEYVYISVREPLWRQVKEALEEEKQVFIKINEKEEVEAVAFQDELEYLLSNIEDNSNYGEKMTSAVAAVFQ
ncbi:UPF0738 family protein [Alkalihalobacterium bogoriense]|uniref:UPF0738 family protein n=1 Tax=Alkalihalobacterium bogoriense TaxID=246272 RepID=UPI00054E95EF|nr:hypothetical protein [Alkalihalobacterium bogoriense]